MSGVGPAFARALGRSEIAPSLVAKIDALHAAARAAWPTVEVPAERFASHLAERIEDPAGDLEAGLASLDAASLYLTCGCLLGMSPAIAALEARFLAELDRVLIRFDGSGAQKEEIKQRIRAKLLVAEDGAVPRISAYTGRGDLLRWLKVVASREALGLLRKNKREILGDDQLLADAVGPAEDQELAYLKQHYRAEFKTAFHDALGELEPRQRTLLRYQLIDSLSIDDIGVIYGVHRATAARWLERIRAVLLEKTRARLMAGIKVDAGELDSIMRLIQSQLDVSIQRILVDEPGD